MSRSWVAVLLVFVAAVSFTAGVWHGGNLEFVRPRSCDPAGEVAPVETKESTPATVRGVELVNGRRWSALEAWLTQHRAELSAGARSSEMAAMLDALEEAPVLHASSVGRVLARYLDIVVDDVRAVMLLTDVYANRGQPRRALGVLIDAAAFTGGADRVAIEERIARLAGRHADELREAGAREQLSSFYEYMVGVRPHQDTYRVGWIRSLIAQGALEQAERVFRETGLQGIEEATLERVGEELEFARSGLVVERLGALMLTEALVNGQSVRLMMDTGASHSALTTERLRRLGARRLRRDVRIMTAGGVVEVPVFELRELSVAGRTFEAFEVLALDDLPSGVDGLLGMDILDGFDWPGAGVAPR